MRGRSKAHSSAADLEWLPVISARAVGANNRVYARKLAFHVAIAGEAVECRPTPEVLHCDRWDDVPLTIGEWTANIRLAPSTAERLLDQYCAGPRSSSFTALQRRILLATALEDAFAAFEQRAGQSVTIEQSVPATAEFKLSVALLGPDFKGYAEIWLPLDAVPALLPRHTSTGEDHDAWVDHIPFTIRRCAGFQRVSWSDLRDLRPGDTVMCEAAEEPRQFAIIGDQMIANLGRDGALVTRWRALSKYGSRDMEPFNKHASDQPMQDGSLADLPVRLTFEVGRTEISLRELRQFDQGSILPVAATIEDCVEIVANGRLIGRGSLLKIGSGLGVRIVQLVPHV